MKRFSWLAFIAVALVHIYITGQLFNASERTARLVSPEPWTVWLTISSWICQPIIMLLSVLRLRLMHNVYYAWIALAWSVCVGVCFGFLIPCLFRSRHSAT